MLRTGTVTSEYVKWRQKWQEMRREGALHLASSQRRRVTRAGRGRENAPASKCAGREESRLHPEAGCAFRRVSCRATEAIKRLARSLPVSDDFFGFGDKLRFVVVHVPLTVIPSDIVLVNFPPVLDGLRELASLVSVAGSFSYFLASL